MSITFVPSIGVASGEIAVRLVLALAIGGLIGLERSYRGRPAGFRTHALVCLSTSLLMLVTVYESSWITAAIGILALGGRPARASVLEHRFSESLLVIPTEQEQARSGPQFFLPVRVLGALSSLRKPIVRFSRARGTSRVGRRCAHGLGSPGCASASHGRLPGQRPLRLSSRRTRFPCSKH